MKSIKNLYSIYMTIKKIIPALVMTAVILCSTSVSAKGPISLGIKGGLQTQSIGNFKSVSMNTLSDVSANNTFGFQLGIISRISFLGMYIQPELVYSSNSFDLSIPDYRATRVTAQDFEVPVLVGAKVAFLNIFAGPVFNLVSETSNKTSEVNLSTRIAKSSVGYQLGAGVELFGGLLIDLRYGGQFRKPIQTVSINNISNSVRTSLNTWQVNIGYLF